MRACLKQAMLRTEIKVDCKRIELDRGRDHLDDDGICRCLNVKLKLEDIWKINNYSTQKETEQIIGHGKKRSQFQIISRT